MRTIAAFTTIEEAYLLKSRLEGSGVAAFVRDEFTVAANPLYSNAIGGVKVEVADDDFDRALEVLDAGPRPAAPGAEAPAVASLRPVISTYLKVVVVVLVVLCIFLALG
ncbi:MAG TPA: DUF2007 domain-containing protein [Opitutaceae bacterium]|nr:DUF2007 domain-containing protein [Opitutaceae bacterium]